MQQSFQNAHLAQTNEKELRLARYLLEQRAFGRDGDVPPDCLEEEEEEEEEVLERLDYEERNATSNDATSTKVEKKYDREQITLKNERVKREQEKCASNELMLRLSGETVSGECLSVSGGTGSGCAYQWQRASVGGAIESIVGAVGPSYVTNESDIGYHIRVIVRMKRTSARGKERNERQRQSSGARLLIAHATTDSTVVAAVSSKHPDDSKMDFFLERELLGSGDQSDSQCCADGTNTNSSDVGDATNDESKSQSPPQNNNKSNSVPASTIGKNAAHSALLNNLLIKSGNDTVNATMTMNDNTTTSSIMNNSNIVSSSTVGDDSLSNSSIRRRKEILLSDNADSLKHGPGSESRLAFIRGKELEAKAAELFRQISEDDKRKNEAHAQDEDDDDEEEKDKANDSTWDSSDYSDESDDYSDEDDYDRDDDDFVEREDDDLVKNKERNISNLTSSNNNGMHGEAKKAARIAQRAKDAYEEAAQKGYPEAMQALGRCYENGFGTLKDIIKAVEWYEKAEKLGCNEALCDLGCLYYLGRFPREVLIKQQRRVEKKQNDKSVSLEEEEDFQSQLFEDRKIAFALFCRAAKNGSGPGANNVAMCYEEGQGGVERSWQEAARWYSVAAHRGVLSAHASLGYAFLTLGNRASAKEAFEIGTQHGAPECADGLRLIREAERHAAKGKTQNNSASVDKREQHMLSNIQSSSGQVSKRQSVDMPDNAKIVSLELFDQLEKELEKYHELSRRLYDAASLHPESLEEANAVLLSAFPDISI